MTKWIKPPARNLCIMAALLASLAGCDGKEDTASEATSSFPTVAKDKTENIPEVLVIGSVTPIPGTEPRPAVTTGGEATPLEPREKNPLLIIDSGKVLNTATFDKVTRFTEIAPDTTEGATFKSSPVYEYNLGNLVAKSGNLFGSSEVFIAPIKGWLRYPEKALNASATTTRFPIIVFEHGMGAQLSYKGYDYLAEDLAAHGYIVISINADENNFKSDPSSQSRGQLILSTLDRLRDIDKGGRLLLQGESVGLFSPLKGKLDFTRIGIMGHSRGGQGVSAAIKFNVTREGTNRNDLISALKAQPSLFKAYPDLAAAFKPGIVATPSVKAVPDSIDETKLEAAIATYNVFFAAEKENVKPYDFKGAFMLAPTDFSGNLGLNNVPLANLLPTCDGDMSDLEGVVAYDHNRFGPTTDNAPRYQIMVHGANHDFYNRIWGDDGSWANPDYCDLERAGSIRLSRPDQERNGLFLINSFMRYHVGGEQKFAAYWNGHAQLPKQSCQEGVSTCDERVVLTIQKPNNRRKLIQRFDQPDSLERNQLGGAITFSGFDDAARCEMPYGLANEYTEAPVCSPKRLKGFEYLSWGGKGLLSIADHAELAWSKPNAKIVTDLSGISAKTADSLTFRLSVVWPIGQEVLVTLTDRNGKAATVVASDFSNALYNMPRPKASDRPIADHPDDANWLNKVPQLLNMVAIPLRAFADVDLNNLKELEFVFPKESGKVAITDIELQDLNRDNILQDLKLAARK